MKIESKNYQIKGKIWNSASRYITDKTLDRVWVKVWDQVLSKAWVQAKDYVSNHVREIKHENKK